MNGHCSKSLMRRGEVDYQHIGIIILMLVLALLIFLIWTRMRSSVFGGG